MVRAHSLSGSCDSISRQALIFSRRHTQHKPSDSSLAVGSPHTRHSYVFRVFGSKTIR